MYNQGSLMHEGSEGWPVWSDPTHELLTVAPGAEEVNAGSDIKMSEYTVHCSLLRIWGCIAAHADPCLPPCHRAKMVQEWFKELNNELVVLTWSPNFPDLNPTKHLWDVQDKHVQSMEAPPRNLLDIDLLLASGQFRAKGGPRQY